VKTEFTFGTLQLLNVSGFLIRWFRIQDAAEIYATVETANARISM
jgi:hypothetical protein